MILHLTTRIPLLIIIMIVAWPVRPLWAQQRLSIDDIFSPVNRIDFDGDPPRGLRWIDDNHYLEKVSETSQQSNLFWKVNAKSGYREPFLDVDRMEEIFRDFPDLDFEQIDWDTETRNPVLNGSLTALVVNLNNDLYYYNLQNTTASRLTNTPTEEEQEVAFSPDGTLIAFIRKHNLHIIDIEEGHERLLTTSGTEFLRNGILDWVYQEEIYGRGNFRGYWWSPDSQTIAFLQLNDTDVPNFLILDHMDYHPNLETWAYPKAGDPNPVVKLGLVSSVGGDVTWANLDKYEPNDTLIVGVEWSPNSDHLVFQVQNREQTWLDLNLADPSSGNTTQLLRETTPTWVNVNGPPMWMKDGTFLWLSERSGWKHIYHYRANGSLILQITDGDWEVRDLHGLDENNGWIYWSGTAHSPIRQDVYRVRLDGSNLTRLSEQEGTHRAVFNPSFSHYLNTYSSLRLPPQISVHESNGTRVRFIDRNQPTTLDKYEMSEPEFLQVTTRDGFVMEALMIKPPDFNPSLRYPVYQHIYGGPHTQRVLDRWSGSTYIYWQLLAQHGFIIWVLDNRTASGKGAISTWPVYKNFGSLELQDLEDGIVWLKDQPYVDPSRIGLEGWSYGGFMVSYALTHSQSYKMGIAGGSVTDWRDYDTIYTERYMLTPENNPIGYSSSSPRFAAHNLKGSLLLIHGTMDENVHMQNTLQLAHELQKAGKQFEMMLYPKSRHRLGSLDLEHHRHKTMLDFSIRHLEPRQTFLRENLSDR